MVTTYLTDCDTLPDPLEAEELLHRLPGEQVKKIRRIRHLSGRKQSFAVWLLLSYLLQQKAGIFLKNPGNIAACIEYQRYGKPVCQGIPFSLSHTGHYAIVSMADTVCKPKEAVGCDIEQVKTYRPKIVRRFFHEAEYVRLEQAQTTQQDELFCRYWTRKESVLKLTGLGMKLPMELFDVTGNRCEIDRKKSDAWWQTVNDEEKQQPEFMQALQLLAETPLFFFGYRYDSCQIAVCSTKNQFSPDIVVVDGEILA